MLLSSRLPVYSHPHAQHCGFADLAKLWSLGHLTSLNLKGAAHLSRVAVRAIASLSGLKSLDLSCCPLLSHSTLLDLSRWDLR